MLKDYSDRNLLYAPSHRQDSTSHSLFIPVLECQLEWEIDQWFHHERLIWQPIASQANALPQSYISLLTVTWHQTTQMRDETHCSHFMGQVFPTGGGGGGVGEGWSISMPISTKGSGTPTMRPKTSNPV